MKTLFVLAIVSRISLTLVCAYWGLIVLLAVLAFLGRSSRTTGPELSYATLIPTAIWESDDISTDDMDIAYLAAEIRDIEAQVQALEAGQTEDIRVATLHEVETELMQINTEFWKE